METWCRKENPKHQLKREGRRLSCCQMWTTYPQTHILLKVSSIFEDNEAVIRNGKESTRQRVESSPQAKGLLRWHRHHVEPRVKLYSPREESFSIPLKYIDVTRTTHTNLDVKQEKRIDDYWNIDGSRNMSDPWTGFTQFTRLEEKSS